MQHNAPLGQSRSAPHVEPAPRAQLIGRFLQPSDFGPQCSGLLLGGDEMFVRLGSRGKRLGFQICMRFVLAELADEVSGFGMPLDIKHQLPLLLRRFPTGSGDIHQPELPQPVDKILALRCKQHKIVSHHRSNHSIEPSPACCCLVFTIFCADFERFSSSSMKRLILRMASS